MRKYKSKSSLRTVYAAVYALFLLLLLSLSQYDSVAELLSGFAGRPLAVNAWAAGFVLTAFAVLIGHLCGRAFRRYRIACGEAAAWWLTAALVSVCFCSRYCGVWHCAGVVFSAVILWAAFLFWERHGAHVEVSASSALRDSLRLRRGLLQAAALCVFAGAAPGVSRAVQYEQRAAQALFKGDADAALRAGERSLDCTHGLFALRCCAWSKTPGALAANVFSRALPGGAAQKGGSALLLPPREGKSPYMAAVCDSLAAALGAALPATDDADALGYFRRCARMAGDRPGVAADYYLCALLLDKRLDEFAAEVRRCYGQTIREGRELPAAYSEAMALYSHLHPAAVPPRTGAVVEANWRDYSEMGDKISERDVRANTLRRYYGGTYWWYYDYAEVLTQ